LSMDIKVMPEALGYKYILVVVDDNTHYVTCFPLKDYKAKTIANIILNEFCMKSGVPKRVVADLAKSFTNEIMQYLSQALGFEIVFISAGNHHQNRTERYISSLQSCLIMSLKSKAHLWPNFVAAATFSLNAFASPALENYSPYELHFKTGPVKLSRYQLNPQTGICSSIAEYIGAVKEKFAVIQEMLNANQQKKQEHQLTKSARDATTCVITRGTLVYMLMPDASRLRDTRSKKIILNWVGPMIIYQLDGRGNALLQRLDGKLLCNLISLRRLKPAYIRTSDGSLLTNKDQVIQQLTNNLDPFAKELRKGLLPDYLEFEDAGGIQHPPPESLLVMHCPTTPNPITELKIHPQPQRFSEMTQPELCKHFEKEQLNPYRHGEYDVIKGSFKDGTLHFLIKHSELDSKQAFYIACTEGVGSLSLLQDTTLTDMKIIGRPSYTKASHQKQNGGRLANITPKG
jgi:hypothetical protein